MLTVKFEEKLGEYKYKVAYIMNKDQVLARFRIDLSFATEERLRAHPMWGVRILIWENELFKKQGLGLIENE